MTFNELLKQRRSVRQYQDKPVPLEVIHEILRECTLAPSAGNAQPWKFIIVHNKAMLKRISDESKKNLLSRIAANPNEYASKYLNVLQNESFNVFYNAPCLVIVLGRSNVKDLLFDCTLAASYFMMSAVTKGLGTCWVNLGMEIEDPELLAELGIPEDCTIVAPIIIGYPKTVPAPPKRKEPEVLKIIS